MVVPINLLVEVVFYNCWKVLQQELDEVSLAINVYRKSYPVFNDLCSVLRVLVPRDLISGYKTTIKKANCGP